MSKLIYAFEKQHIIGSICTVPCPQCGDEDDSPPIMTGPDGLRIKPQPLFIRRESNREEYLQSGDPGAAPIEPSLFEQTFYYEVSTD